MWKTAHLFLFSAASSKKTIMVWVLAGIFSFYISSPSKFSSTLSPLCIMFWSLKDDLHAKDDTSMSVNIDILHNSC